jgi:hypothetical protein
LPSKVKMVKSINTDLCDEQRLVFAARGSGDDIDDSWCQSWQY